MKVTYPISAGENEYLLLIDSFNKSILPEEIISSLKDIEIVDITLKRVAGDGITKLNILFDISNLIAGFLLDNDNTIIYFYCDDMHEISRRNKDIAPQKFRSEIFSAMFDRYISSHKIDHIVNIPIEIKADRDIYIHLIARNMHLPYVNTIKESLTEMSKE